MATLKSIRDSILVQSQNIPNSTAYMTHINKLINQAHRDVWFLRPWKFNWKTTQVPLVADKTSERYWDVTVNADPGIQIVTFVGTSPYVDNVLTEEDVFQVIELDGFDYTIIAVSGNLALLEQPFKGEQSLFHSTAWRIKHQYYWLPNDAVEILDVSFRDSKDVGAPNVGKINQVPQRLVIDRGFSKQSSTDQPNFYTPIEPIYAVALEDGNYSGGSPLFGITASAVVKAGSEVQVPAGTWYVGASVVYGAADVSRTLPETSVLWDNASVTTNGTTHVIQAQLANVATNHLEGMYIKWYIGIDNGLGEIVGWELSAGDGSNSPLFSDFNSTTWKPDGAAIRIALANFETGIAGYLGQQRKIYPRLDHAAKRIQFYPRPDFLKVEAGPEEIDPYLRAHRDYFFDLRYIYEPRPVYLSGDALQLPEEFSYLIVDRVLADLYLMLNNPTSAQLHERKYKDRLAILTGRYASEKDNLLVRGNSWNRSLEGGLPLGYTNLVRYTGS